MFGMPECQVLFYLSLLLCELRACFYCPLIHSKSCLHTSSVLRLIRNLVTNFQRVVLYSAVSNAGKSGQRLDSTALINVCYYYYYYFYYW